MFTRMIFLAIYPYKFLKKKMMSKQIFAKHVGNVW